LKRNDKNQHITYPQLGIIFNLSENSTFCPTNFEEYIRLPFREIFKEHLDVFYEVCDRYGKRAIFEFHNSGSTGLREHIPQTLIELTREGYYRDRVVGHKDTWAD